MSRYPENRNKKCNSVMMSIRIDKNMKKQLDKACAILGCSQRELIERALKHEFISSEWAFEN